MVEVEAVSLQGAGMAIAHLDHRLEALAPPAGDGVEAKPGRGRHASRLEGRDQIRTFAPCRDQIGTGGTEMKAPSAAGADREAAVRLSVDAALDTGPLRLRPVCHRRTFP